MGRTVTSKYAVRITVPGYNYSPMSWQYRRYGRPTDASLARYVRDFEASTLPGGSNAHLGEQHVSSAYIRVNEHAGTVVATYKAAPFIAVS
jgi:hypothetical protein